MAKILFHSLVGSANPTRACFPFLQALANKERGDEVAIALGGDAVALVQDVVIESIVPPGWPPLRETFSQIVRQGVALYVCAGCSKARGVTEEDLKGKNACFIASEEPQGLYSAWDRVVVY